MSEDFGWLDGNADVDFSGPVAVEKPLTVQDPGKKVLVTKRRRRPPELVRAERKLTPIQRFYARMLVETETISAAELRMGHAGYKVDRSTYYRWRKMPVFIEVLHLSQSYLFDCLGISKERVMNDAEKIKQIALTPQPILHQGRDTGFREIQLGAALRAIELQGKGVGLNDGDANRIQVNIDIDFSGRVDGIDAGEDSDVIEGEFEYVDR